MMDVKNLKLVDCTLREGEQHPGVCFSISEKIHLAELLHSYGVDVIEIGHPGINSEEEIHCTQVISAINPSIISLVHSRANEKEVLSAVRTGAAWVGIWISINDIALESKFTERSIDWIIKQAKESIELAKKNGLLVRFTIEDASRTEWNSMESLIKVALEAGADRISFADTVGIWHPSLCKETIMQCKRKFNCEIEVHLHNDLGLALANALAAIEAGVDVVDVSVLGLGERAGITDLFQLSTCLSQFYHLDRFKLSTITELSNKISTLIGFMPDPMRPLVGSHVFTHSSHYHQQAVQRNSKAYEGISPEKIGKKTRIIKATERRDEIERINDLFQIKKPYPKLASELQYHRNGPGTRWLMMDKRMDARSCLYIIQRTFDNECLEDLDDIEKKHVDAHQHHCPSVFVFWGNNTDGSGLSCKVMLGEQEKIVESPATIYIPAEVTHSYHYISGAGSYWNIVLSPDYNSSLLEKNHS